jgi:iron(III) transport system ATP-binding protein
VLSDEVAVMHEGRVLQVAGPESVYTRPANRTVAAFLGMPNLFDAKVREVRDAAGDFRARVRGDGWEGWCSTVPGVTAGEAVTVIVRPEAVRLVPGKEAGRGTGPRSDAESVWTGVVRQRFFRGTRNLYTIDVGPLSISVDAPPDQPLAPGSEVMLRVDSAQMWAVRD